MPASHNDPLASHPAVQWSLTRHGPMMYFARDQYIGTSLREYGEFSQAEFDLLGQIVRPGDTVVEAGANIGALTIPIARALGPGGRIYAIEAQRRVFQLLCANVVLSGLPNVHTVHAAVTTSAEALRVPALDYAAAANFGGVSLHRETDAGAQTEESVAPLAIDDLDLPTCRMIKVDVEGMELDVLRSARRTIARCRPILYVENDRRDNSPALIELIRSQGYRLWWHLPYLYNPRNFTGNPTNLFETIVSINMVCAPEEANFQFTNGQAVTGPQDFPPVAR